MYEDFLAVILDHDDWLKAGRNHSLVHPFTPNHRGSITSSLCFRQGEKKGPKSSISFSSWTRCSKKIGPLRGHCAQFDTSQLEEGIRHESWIYSWITLSHGWIDRLWKSGWKLCMTHWSAQETNPRDLQRRIQVRLSGPVRKRVADWSGLRMGL